MLSGGDTATIIPHHINSPDLQFSFPLRQGELEVLVNYRYGIWRVLKQRHFSFTAMTSTGQTAWAREPRTDWAVFFCCLDLVHLALFAALIRAGRGAEMWRLGAMETTF